MKIREIENGDWDLVWPIFKEVVRAGATYAYDINTTKEQGENIWIKTPRKVFLVEDNGVVLGTYYLKTNQPGPGNHVANCGYMVSSKARGKGVATLMCEHSQTTALELGYHAIQFNFVVSTNDQAVRLWTKLGFETVGRLPKAYDHTQLGYVDALVMYKWLK